MTSQKPASKKASVRKKKRRRISKTKVVLLVAAAAIVIAGIGFGSRALIKTISSKQQEKTPEIQEASSQTISLEALKPTIADAFEMRRLNSLDGDIHTYFFNTELDDLKSEINEYLASQNIDASQISWSVQDLTTNAFTESDNARTNFVAASTYKLPLAMVWYQRIANGQNSMTDKFIFTENMLEDEDEENLNQPIHKKFKVGDTIQLDELLEAALLYSDNIAGHMLFENMGGYSAYKSAASQFSDSTQSEEFITTNVLNADYTMDMLYQLYNTPGIYNDAKYWLTYANTGDFLNANGAYGYVQKIGNINENRNALGLMIAPFPYSISIFSKIDKDKGEQVIADLGTICYNYFLNKYNSGFYDGSQADRIAEANAQVSIAPENPVNDRPRPGGPIDHNDANHENKQAEGEQKTETPASDASQPQPAPEADQNPVPAQ